MLSTKELYPCNNHSNPDGRQISTDPCRLKNFITQDTIVLMVDNCYILPF